MVQLALLVTVSVSLAASAPPTKLKSYQLALPETLDAVVNGISLLTGGLPQIEGTVADTSAEGQKPEYTAAITLTDGKFKLPAGSVPFTFPAEVETILAYVEGTTGTRPELEIDFQIIDVTPAPEATAPVAA